MTEQDLMRSIRSKWEDLLRSTAATSKIPESFFAALIAGESGGDPAAKRFEPAVFSALAEVLLGRRPAYGSIGAQDILDLIGQVPAPNSFVDVLHYFSLFAYSWGLTQIMGYEAIAFRLNGVSGLEDPPTQLAITVRMLNQFAYHNHLDVTKNFAELFDCWNTGRPHGTTADPKYIANGIARMGIYEALSIQTT